MFGDQLRLEPLISRPQQVNPVSIPIGLQATGMRFGNGCYETTSQRFAAKKKISGLFFAKNIRFFANFNIWKEQRAQEPESLESNNKVSYFCKNISYCIP